MSKEQESESSRTPDRPTPDSDLLSEEGVLLETTVELAEGHNVGESDPLIIEENLLNTIRSGKFQKIKRETTPRALEKCTNSLLTGMKVSFQLRRLADKKGPDEEKFIQLANSVENFTYRLLDPLKYNESSRQEFGENVLDYIMDEAIDLDQKKFFTHPVAHGEMNRKWHGRDRCMQKLWHLGDFKKSERHGRCKSMNRTEQEQEEEGEEEEEANEKLSKKSKWKRWIQLLLLHLLCGFDLVFSPILLLVISIIKETRRKGNRITRIIDEEEDETVAVFYLKFLETPYFKYVRDTLSYIVLVCLHYALCLSPSTIAFSGLEWTILIFFVGRYLVERKQILDILQRVRLGEKNRNVASQTKCLCLEVFSRYQSDCWNRLDFVSLLVYLTILILRVTTWIKSGSEMNNRTLAVAGYFYSFNTLCLTLRAFGYVMEQSRHVGTIQIALFSILFDIRTVIWQFTAALLAFSIAITKVYMAEKSFSEGRADKNKIACMNSGISCWWAMFTHLGWSLLGVSEESDPMVSVDGPSETIARLLFGVFLIFGVILLLNMLIALLSNTYQRTQENSFKVWSIKRAITIQTYAAYDPIPVPLNIIYSIFKLFRKKNGKQKEDLKEDLKEDSKKDVSIKKLETAYFAKHTNLFPVTDEKKLKMVWHETEKNRRMLSQILSATFKFQDGGQEVLNLGPEAWVDVHKDIRIEGLLLTCEGPLTKCRPGARYSKPFSPDFPHFEMTILETGKENLLAIGVVNEGYDNTKMPGWRDESVGYHIDDGKIFQSVKILRTDDDDSGTCSFPTTGPAMARRGDRIRCTFMLDKKRESDGRVPVFFTLNGRRIQIMDTEYAEFFMDTEKPLYPYIAMTSGCSVLAKMLHSENLHYRRSQLHEVKHDIAEVGNEMKAGNARLKADNVQLKADNVQLKADNVQLKADNAQLKADNVQLKADNAGVRKDLEVIVSREVAKLLTSLEAKLDVALAKPIEN